jgi:hypothetical protein
MIIPGFLISILTFPGVIVHETAHLLFCRYFKVSIFEVCYFRLGNPCGYVVHAAPRDFKRTFFISMGPFFLNSILCVLFCSAAFAPIWVLKVEDPLAYFFAWIGLSMGMNAFPSTTDLKHIWDLAPQEAKRLNPLAIVSLPVIAILFVLNMGRIIWADLGYGIAIGFLGPLALMKLMA